MGRDHPPCYTPCDVRYYGHGIFFSNNRRGSYSPEDEKFIDILALMLIVIFVATIIGCAVGLIVRYT